MSTVVVTTCKSCGAEMEADREAIVAGLWRTCPRCRSGRTETVPVMDDDAAPAAGSVDGNRGKV
jgi:hypothetical protein